ncbi:MAG: class IIb bacteriocin, lactobin A/cerein 7B family, partial [Bacteroidota bacterium]
GLTELSVEDQSAVNGGFITLVFAYVLQAALVATLAGGVVGSFESGYKQATEK